MAVVTEQYGKIATLTGTTANITTAGYLFEIPYPQGFDMYNCTIACVLLRQQANEEYWQTPPHHIANTSLEKTKVTCYLSTYDEKYANKEYRVTLIRIS